MRALAPSSPLPASARRPWLALPIGLLLAAAASAAPVAVRYQEGAVHGFLTLSTMAGKAIASGDLLQEAHGDRVTSRLVFHFKDGSVQDETIVYSDRRTFRLLSDHLVQKGPSFPHPTEVTLDAGSGQVTVRATDEHGKTSWWSERLAMPEDLTNGMLLLTQLKNVTRGASLSLSVVAATPKPQMVKVAVSSAGLERLSIGGSTRQAVHYVIRADLGAITGFFARLLGKQPPDSHVWILAGPVPAFVKSESPFYVGGPLWRLELAKPVFSAAAAPPLPRPPHTRLTSRPDRR